MSTAKRTDPKLWERVKDEVTKGDKGGRPGQWSARKAQFAVQEYKRRGGGYEGGGRRKDETDLHRWTEQDWDTKSGERSRDTGERYLPKGERERLSDEEYRRTSDKKRRDTARGKQFSSQPADVRRKTSGLRRDGEPTKAELYERAKRRNVPGRSKMGKAELRQALAG